MTQHLIPIPRITGICAAAAVLAGSLVACGSGAGSGAGQLKIGLVTKTETNPYFVKLRESATAAAKAKGAQLIALAGKFDGDNEGQVTAVENLIAKGVKGILITPSNSTGVLGVIKKARQKGILVIALDTATSPASAVDATYATDNTAAGRLQGAWVKAHMGSAPARVAMLDGTPGATVDDNRHDGFLAGFGITNSSPEIVGRAITNGAQDKGQQGMENLLQAHPDINAVYTINEPAARGAAAAIKAAGTKGVTVGSIDGSCAGVQAVKSGQVGATVMQFPKKMAEMGVAAVDTYAKTKKKPSGFIDTGAQLITDKPEKGLPSKDTAWGLKNCWG
ncbi:MAG TPA: substrate-binding domain-containing protein [Streptosporangiaceae bacterium]|jgi:fructose transport system substrate-binding protein